MLRSAGLLLLAATLSGCGRDGGLAGEDRPIDGSRPTGNEIRNLTNPQDPSANVQPPQLDPIGFAEMEAAGVLGAGCSFNIGDDVMLASGSGRAVVKIGGQVVRLTPAAPVNDRGGLFQSETISVSVGRGEEQGRTQEEVTTWPARAAITDRANDVTADIEGVWACGA